MTYTPNPLIGQLGGAGQDSGGSGLVSTQKPLVLLPNPAKAEARAVYYLKQSGKVQLTLLTLDGQSVRKVEFEALAGEGSAELNLGDLASGLYWAVLKVDEGPGMVVRGSFKLAHIR
jgi:hypothetical protein